MQIRAVLGSLTEGDDDVLVNASNTALRLGSGVSAAIGRACGPGYQAALDEHRTRCGELEQGDVVITGAGHHPRAKAVAHVAVMDYRGGVSARSFPSLATIEAAVARLWPKVEATDLPSVRVAMVALGAGTGGLGPRDSVRVAAESLRAYRELVPTTKIAAVTFYAVSILEHVAMAAALADVFPEVLDGLSPEALDLVDAMRRGRA